MPEIGKVENIRNLIALEFASRPGKNEMDAAINWVISQFNLQVGGQKVIIAATGVGESDWEDLSTDSWEDWDTASWESLGRFKGGFSWNSDDYYLQLPGNIMTVERIYINNIPWEKVTYDKMKQNTSSKVFSQLDDKLYFATDLSAATTSIKLVCKIDWEDVDNVDEITIPRQWKNIIVAGAVTKLGTKDRHVISELGYQQAIAEYTTGLVRVFNHYALRNSLLSDKLDGIEEIDLGITLDNSSISSSDYGSKS